MLLEMLELMLRHLPDILLEMSKMSTTLNVAVPVLEFLSSKLLFIDLNIHLKMKTKNYNNFRFFFF